MFLSCRKHSDDPEPETPSVSVVPEVDYEAVDLGLSVLWCNKNLGAKNAYSAGDYYAWGEVDTKDLYSPKTYSYCDSDLYSLTKYSEADGFTRLLLFDDAAYVQLGENWRMPTVEECNELINNCLWTWQSAADATTPNGYTITSKTNGNSIFLPIVGRYEESGFYGWQETGSYWTSDLDTEQISMAKYIRFTESKKGKISSFARSSGLPIRPVSDK